MTEGIVRCNGGGFEKIKLYRDGYLPTLASSRTFSLILMPAQLCHNHPEIETPRSITVNVLNPALDFMACFHIGIRS